MPRIPLLDAIRLATRPWVVVASVPLLMLSFCPAASKAVSPPPSLRFGESGLVGGGFVNVVAEDPSGNGVVIAGGDVSGFHRSIDQGQHWITSNTGLDRLEELSVASIAFSDTVPGTVFAAVGIRGAGGGLLVSTDDGQSWSLRSTVPQFSGANNTGVAGLPQTHPRSTGRLLAVDGAHGLLYAATFSKGLMRSADGGVSWKVLGLAGKHLRGLAFDPGNPNTLYVGVYNGGVYKTTTASTTGTFAKLVGSPNTPEELWLSGTTLYVAGGKAGVFRSMDAGATWSRLGVGQIPMGGPAWMSIDGYQACGRDVVYVGSYNGLTNAIMRSVDGGTTWTSLTADPTLAHLTIGGPGGEPWWLASQPAFLLGGIYYAASQIVLGPGPASGPDCLESEVLVAGRSGLWSSTDAGTNWYPLVAGLGVTIARDVASDPAVPGRAYVASADWVFHDSTDGLAHVTQLQPPVGTTGADIAIDPSTSPGGVYLTTGNPSSDTNGMVYSSADPTTTAWTDERLSTKTGGKRPLAIVTGTIGVQRVLIAAVENSGVWRDLGGVWTRVNATAMAHLQPSRGASLVWPPGSTTLYLYDHTTGVWRSNDSGGTWSKIWSVPSLDAMTGFLAVDPSSPGTLYVSVEGTGVFRIDNATAGSVDAGSLTPLAVGTFTHPGAMEFASSGDLYVASLAASGTPPGLFASDDRGVTWIEVSDDFYAAAAGFVFDLSVGPDGTVYAATNGDGVIVGTPG